MKAVSKIEFLSQQESNPPKCIELRIDLTFRTRKHDPSDKLFNNQKQKYIGWIIQQVCTQKSIMMISQKTVT